MEALVGLFLAAPSKGESKLDVLERALLARALEIAGGNKSEAARLVGIERKALERRWEKLGQETEEEGASRPD
jgi:DNA-binding NtrC family response regulator